MAPDLREAAQAVIDWHTSIGHDSMALRELQAALSGRDEEIGALRELAGACYAGPASEYEFPDNWLDALAAAASGDEFSTDGLLPFSRPAGCADGLTDEQIINIRKGQCRCDGRQWSDSIGFARAVIHADRWECTREVLTDEQIEEVWSEMPGGPQDWLKQFGFLQFARAVLAKARMTACTAK